ncbi:MAG: hypothetical protein V1776_02075 [Candidatus Diapherotrites archaeon]
MSREEFSLVKQVHLQYRENLKLSLSFAILLVFVFFFLRFGNIALFNGTMFFDYSFSPISWEVMVAQFLAGLVFISMYSILLTLLLLAVRNDLSHIKVRYYLREMVQKFFVKMVSYFIILSILFVGLVLIGLGLNVPIIWLNLLLLLISLSLVFVPQSLVIDEKPIWESIQTNWYVIRAHPSDFLLVIVLGTVLIGLLPLVEAFIDSFIYVGRYITVLLMFGFVIPFLEILKSILYMNRFELVRGHEYARKKHLGLRGLGK